MKKTYSKPEILFESFAMSTSIAVGCECDTPLPSYEENCGYPIRGGVVFVEGTSCTTSPQGADKDQYNGFCYHVFDSEHNFFNS